MLFVINTKIDDILFGNLAFVDISLFLLKLNKDSLSESFYLNTTFNEVNLPALGF